MNVSPPPQSSGGIGQFLKKLVKTYFMSVGIAATLSPILFAATLALLVSNLVETSQTGAPKAEPTMGAQERMAIKMTLDGVLSDRTISPQTVFFNQLFGEDNHLSLRRLVKILRRAKVDDRVQGIYVEMENFGANRANMTELRRAFLDFKESKKSLHFHLLSPGTLDYYLGSVADYITIGPVDGLTLTGPMFNLLYMKTALNKLGVEYDLVRAGKFKSAAENLVADDPSAPTLEMYKTIQDNLIQHFVDVVATSRKKTPDEVRHWLKKSFYLASEAVEVGLVDQVTYAPEAFEAFEKKFENTEMVKPSVFLRESEHIDEPMVASSNEKIGYIEAFGTILQFNPNGNSSEPIITPENTIQQIKFMAEDDDVKVVVMRVVSPGGSALASEMIWHEIKKLAASKPVVVSMGGVAASGGYYIAAPATKILADPSTITGSIGVYSAFLNGEGIKDKWGLSFHMVSQSDRRNVFDLGSSLTKEDRDVLQAQTDAVYQTFLERVGEGRKMSTDDVHKLAQGRVYTGAEALSLGLVDHLGGLQEAFKEAKKLAKLDETKFYRLATYQPDPKTPFDCLQEDVGEMVECLQGIESFAPAMSWLNPRSGVTEIDDGLRSLQTWLEVVKNDRVIAMAPHLQLESLY